jgi:predicted TIM-barrel fold metal-dependent hydrolase
MNIHQNQTTKVAAAGVRAAPAKLTIVDCDFHPNVRGLEDVKPYLSARWWEHLQTYGQRPRHGFIGTDPYPKMSPGANRRDAWGSDGDWPACDLDMVQHHYLDAYKIDYAMMTPLQPTGQADQNLDFSAALATACNMWQIDAWTTRDPRLKGAIIVPYEGAVASVAEIERHAGNPDFSQILMLARTSEPMGRRRYWPIYEAAERLGLPIAVHVFGYSGYPVSGIGWPSYYLEETSGHSTACQAVVTSMVLEGVFERFKNLKVVLIEGGFGWLHALTWRLDRHFESLRVELPHLTRRPSEYVRENIWVTTQPVEEPDMPNALAEMVEWTGEDRILFSSDYPHWDFDDPALAIPQNFDPVVRRKILGENALKLYGLKA